MVPEDIKYLIIAFYAGGKEIFFGFDIKGVKLLDDKRWNKIEFIDDNNETYSAKGRHPLSKGIYNEPTKYEYKLKVTNCGSSSNSEFLNVVYIGISEPTNMKYDEEFFKSKYYNAYSIGCQGMKYQSGKVTNDDTEFEAGFGGKEFMDGGIITMIYDTKLKNLSYAVQTFDDKHGDYDFSDEKLSVIFDNIDTDKEYKLAVAGNKPVQIEIMYFKKSECEKTILNKH